MRARSAYCTVRLSFLSLFRSASEREEWSGGALSKKVGGMAWVKDRAPPSLTKSNSKSSTSENPLPLRSTSVKESPFDSEYLTIL